MSIVMKNGEAVVMTGNGIEVYRLALLLSGLDLQAKGIRMSRHLPQATTIAREQYGLKGTMPKLRAQVEALLAKAKAATCYVEEVTPGTVVEVAETV